MNFPKNLLILTTIVLLLAIWKVEAKEEDHHSHHHHEAQTAETMSSHHMHSGPHMKFTDLRPQNPEDLKRADEIVSSLQKSLEKYKDYKVAINDGYKPFLPNVKLPMYHFTNYRYGFNAAFRFDPEKPTSLLYKKTSTGYELIGAMYTARKNSNEETLNERIPLSVAQWHAHINICLPPKDKAKTADWRKFGPAGSISSEAICKAEGGRFFPQLFGWMVHVYPYEKTREKIWTH